MEARIIGQFCGSDIVLKEESNEGLIVEYDFDNQFLAMKIRNDGKTEVLSTNMNCAQIYFNVHGVKEIGVAYLNSDEKKCKNRVLKEKNNNAGTV